MNNNASSQPQAIPDEIKITLRDLQLLSLFQVDKMRLEEARYTDARSKKSIQKKIDTMDAVSKLLSDYEGMSLDEISVRVEGLCKGWEEPGIFDGLTEAELDIEMSRYENFMALRDFFLQNKNVDLKGRMDFQKWKNEREKGRKESKAVDDRHEEQVMHAHDGDKINALRQENALKLIAEHGAIRAETSYPQKMSSKARYNGFHSVDHRYAFSYSTNSGAKSRMADQFCTGAEPNGQYSNETMMKTIRAHNVHEVVDIRPATKIEFVEVVIPAIKGVFGIGGQPERRERKATGRQIPYQHSELVTGGNKEPAWRMTYYVDDPEWKDYSGRRGQYLQVEIILPESAMKVVEKEIDADPKFIRKIVEHHMKERVLDDPSTWSADLKDEETLRPRYETWKDAKIYIQKEGDMKGWNEHSARNV